MPAVPLALTVFKRRGQPEARLVNRFPEKAGQEAALLTRPGLVAFATVGDGPIRGVLRKPGAFGGDALVVSGGSLYRVTTAGVATYVGLIGGTARVSMDASVNEAKIANGENLYNYDGDSLTIDDFPDDAAVTSVAHIRGFWLAVRADSQALYTLIPGDVEWDALSVVSAEQSPDKLVAVLVVGDEIWLMGEDTVETWVLSGVVDPPIQPIGGRVSEKGCISPDTITKTDNAPYWVAEDNTKGRIVCRGRGGDSPEIISDPSMSERLAGADPLSLRAFAFGIEGHEFYCLTIGGVGTFAYDVSTGAWCEFASAGRPGFRAHLGSSAPSGPLLLGDDTSGALYTLDAALATDVGGPMERIVTGRVEISAPARCNRAMLDASLNATGAAVTLSTSDDNGNTWVSHGARDLGVHGEYDVRVWWNRLGLMRGPGRIFELSETSAVPTVLHGLEVV